MVFAQQEIGERAAIPKTIYVVKNIPQTAVGKIFKPPLVQQQVQSVFEADLLAMDGIEKVTIAVDADAMHGMIARVLVVPRVGVDTAVLEKAINKQLGQYPVYYEIKGL